MRLRQDPQACPHLSPRCHFVDLVLLVPLGAIKRFLSKKLVKYGQHPSPAQQAVYIKDQKDGATLKRTSRISLGASPPSLLVMACCFVVTRASGAAGSHLDGHANGDMLVDDTDDTCAGKDSGYYHHGFILHVLCFRAL